MVLDYEKLYQSYYLQVYSYIMTIVKNQSLAEEITQNTFFKAITAKRSFKQNSSELTWLCSIARRLAMDEFRKNQKAASLNEASISDDRSSPEEHMEDQETALRIHLILHDLKEPYKEVFQLRVFGELPFSQIGYIFGKTENWARVTYYRAKLKIQERMEANE